MSDKALLMSIAEKLTYLKLKSQSRSDPGGNFETMYYLTGARDNMGGQVYVYKNFLYVDLYTGRTKFDLFTCENLIEDIDSFVREHVVMKSKKRKIVKIKKEQMSDDEALLTSIAEKLTYLKLKRSGGGQYCYLTGGIGHKTIGGRIYVYKNYLRLDLYTKMDRIDLFTCENLIEEIDTFVRANLISLKGVK